MSNRGGRSSRAGTVVRGAGGVALVIVVWQVLRVVGALPSSSVPSPTATVEALWNGLVGGSLGQPLGETLLAWGLGLAIATLIAVPAGLAVGFSKPVYSVLRVVVEFLRPLPSVALAPIAILFLGIGLQMSLALIIFASFWPIFFNSMYGVAQTEPQLLEVGRVAKMSRLNRVVRIVLPSAAPMVVAGIRVSAPIALILAIIAEMVGGGDGLGSLFNAYRLGNQVPEMYATVLLTGIVGYLINGALQLTYQWCVPWSVENRRTE